jgi:hypothetical protein
MKNGLRHQHGRKKNAFLRKAFIALFLFASFVSNGQTISTGIFGQNAWWYNSADPTNLIQYLDEVEASGVKYVRIGGIDANYNPLYSWQTNYSVTSTDLDRLRDLIDGIRAHHMEPMIEVGFTPSGRSCPNTNISLSNQALIAANVVDRLNNIEGYNIQYWIIANEPDLSPNSSGCGGGFGYDQSSEATSIATYIKEFSSQMKLKDPSIKIVGPETAWYNWNVIDKLTTTGGADDVTGLVTGKTYYYTDIISFHLYSYPGSETQDRAHVIANLTKTDGFRDHLIQLKARLAHCDTVHSRTGSSELKMAVTEANINYANPSGDNVGGVGANSFLGGQFWAEAMGICMEEGVQFLNFWSIKEGQDLTGDIGYLNRSDATPKPTYYHFQMVADNFSGYYYGVTDNQTNVKAFASKSATNLIVMIMNEEQTTDFPYTIRLNNGTVSGSDALKLNVTYGDIDVEYASDILNESSVVLVFDLAGNLVKKSVYEITNATSPPVDSTYETTNANDTMIAKNASWKYLDNGSNAGTGWRATSFNDASWSSGNAELGYGDGGEATTLSYGSDPNNKYITTYFRKSFTVSTPSDYTSLILDLVRDDGAVVYLNGTEVYRTNMPTGTITYTTVASAAVINADESTYFNTTFSSSGLVSGTNVIAVELHQNAVTSSDISFNLQLRGVRSPCTPPSAPTAGGNTPVCAGSTINLTASTISGATYSWSGPNGFTSTLQNPSITNSTVAMSGTYSVTATVGGCTSSAGTKAITVNGTSAPTAGGNTPVCAGSTINLTANTISGATYSWTGPASFTSSSQNPSRTNATTAMSGTYSVTATVGGCTSAAGTKTITVNAIPSTPTAGSNSPVCQGSTINLTSNTVSGATYSWTGPASFSSSLQNPSRTGAGVNMDGTYSVTVTVSGCTSAAGTTAVTIPNFASIGTGGPTTFCAGGSVALYASTGTGYSWQWRKKDGSGVFQDISGATANNYTATLAGDYDVRIYNGTCYAWSAPVTVTVNSTSAPTAGGNTPVCAGSTINLTASTISGATYSWTGPNSFTSSSQNPSRTNATTAMSGTYSVTATANGCTSSPGTKTITVNAIPSTPTAGSNSPVCQGSTINLTCNTVSGATYSWTGPASFSSSSQNPSRTGAGVNMDGTYSVTVTVNGCTSAAGTTNVTIPDFASIGAGGATTFCSGGSVTLYAATGSGYSWQWRKKDGSGVFQNISGATANNYTASPTATSDYDVQIYNGTCYAWSAPTTVTINSSLVATITPGGPTTFCTGGSVVLHANTCSGYTYQWRKKDSFGNYQDISGATSANYTATTADWFQVRVTSGSSNVWSSGIQTIINCRTAEQGLATDSSITTSSALSVFPNPNKGEFTVVLSVPDENDKVVSVDILNELGQTVYASGQISVTTSSIEIPVAITEDYPGGVYIIKAIVGDNVMYSKITVSR